MGERLVGIFGARQPVLLHVPDDPDDLALEGNCPLTDFRRIVGDSERHALADGILIREVAANELFAHDDGARNLEAVLGLGESLARTDEASLQGRAGRLFETALARGSNDPRAFWYGGIVALHTGTAR